MTSPSRQLSKLHLFRSCTRTELRTIDSLTTWVHVEPGRVLCRQGEVGREFFVIADGAVTVSQNGQPIRRLERGEAFGDIALLNLAPRSATVTTAVPTEVLVFNRAEFTTMLDRVPHVGRQLLAQEHERSSPLRPIGSTQFGTAERRVETALCSLGCMNASTRRRDSPLGVSFTNPQPRE